MLCGLPCSCCFACNLDQPKSSQSLLESCFEMFNVKIKEENIKVNSKEENIKVNIKSTIVNFS